MPRGGARNRSGPPADPRSGRSEARRYSLRMLPAQGFKGRVPKFPLPDASERELEVWRQAWRTPQACAWSLPSEKWRHPTVALWVRIKVRCEDPDAKATLLSQLHRLADQVGMTTAGLAEMGWAVAVDEVSEKAAARDAADEQSEPAPARPRRLRAVPGDQ